MKMQTTVMTLGIKWQELMRSFMGERSTGNSEA
jgi:hypothetical protein